MHFFIHNSAHSGDVLLTRIIITIIKETYPDVQITLECLESKKYLWEDLGFKIVDYKDKCGHRARIPTVNCPSDAIFINMWFGVYPDLLGEKYYRLTYENNVYTFNRQMQEHDLQHLYKLSVPEVTPALRFFTKPEIPITVDANSILVENGRVYSGQTPFIMNDHLEEIVNAYPQFIFYCSAPPPSDSRNLVDCSQYNLIELSEISNRCKALLTLCSGVNAATYTEENRFKPRCYVGVSNYSVWNNIQNPVFQARNIQDVFTFMNKVNKGEGI
jgi:hypothetical protein